MASIQSPALFWQKVRLILFNSTALERCGAKIKGFLFVLQGGTRILFFMSMALVSPQQSRHRRPGKPADSNFCSVIPRLSRELLSNDRQTKLNPVNLNILRL